MDLRGYIPSLSSAGHIAASDKYNSPVLYRTSQSSDLSRLSLQRQRRELVSESGNGQFGISLAQVPTA